MKNVYTSLFAYFFLFASAASGEVLDHGGYPERFKGAGDKVPPNCQFSVPDAAKSPFFIKWNCGDDNASQNDIRTELWMYRNGEAGSILVGNFLGFPAAAYINESVLGAEKFTDGLPVSFRLLARDTAGNTTVSPILSVRTQAASLESCTLQVITQATDSLGGTTGLPSLSVILEASAIITQNVTDSLIRVATSSPQEASTCEITSLCAEENKVAFDSSIKIENDSAKKEESTLILSPDSITVTLSEVSLERSDDGALITSLSMAGTTSIDSQEADVTLRCTE